MRFNARHERRLTPATANRNPADGVRADMRIKHLVITAMAVLALAACGTDEEPATTAPTPAQSSTQSPAVLRASTTALGDVVADASGRTAYIFAKDQPGSGRSACYDECATKWPPVLVTSTSPVATGVTGTLGTITRTDGRMQLTLNGYPLYLFAADGAPGQTKGQDVNHVWFVVKADGTPVKPSPSAA